jgi:hypothetical protein
MEEMVCREGLPLVSELLGQNVKLASDYAKIVYGKYNQVILERSK